MKYQFIVAQTVDGTAFSLTQTQFPVYMHVIKNYTLGMGLPAIAFSSGLMEKRNEIVRRKNSMDQHCYAAIPNKKNVGFLLLDMEMKKVLPLIALRYAIIIITTRP